MTSPNSTAAETRKLRTRTALRSAMLELLAEKPFDQILITDLTNRAHVGYATFFRHHPTKEALLDSIATDEIAQLNKLTLAIRAADNYEAGFQALCAYVDEHRSLWSILLNGGAGSAMREEWVHQSQLVAAREKPIASWLPTELGTICAATWIAETLAWWLAQPPRAYSVDDIAKILYRMLATSIMAPD